MDAPGVVLCVNRTPLFKGIIADWFNFGTMVRLTREAQVAKLGSKSRALMIYNGNSKGELSGGGYAYSKIREVLGENFNLSEILIDEITSRFHNSRLRWIVGRLGLAYMVIFSFVMYNKFELVVTNWAPGLPFNGDITYVQPLAGGFDPFYDPDATGIDFEIRRILKPYAILSGPSLRRQTLVVNSHFTEGQVKEKLGKTALVVYPPVPKYPDVNLWQKRNLVLCMGRVAPSKNFQALEVVGPKVPDCKFVLLGKLEKGGNEVVRSINIAFEKAHRASDFAFEGWVPQSVKASYLQMAKVVFNPAHFEPFGIALVEGMLNGATPIAHNSGGPTEFVPKRYLFSDYENAAEKIRDGLVNWSQEEAHALRQSALRYDESRFNEEFLGVLNAVVRKKRRL
jgi:glycosyltransferase involved in cell wall biosynthesis